MSCTMPGQWLYSLPFFLFFLFLICVYSFGVEHSPKILRGHPYERRFIWVKNEVCHKNWYNLRRISKKTDIPWDARGISKIYFIGDVQGVSEKLISFCNLIWPLVIQMISNFWLHVLKLLQILYLIYKRLFFSSESHFNTWKEKNISSIKEKTLNYFNTFSLNLRSFERELVKL